MEGDHVGHQLVKGQVSVQLTSGCAAAALNAIDTHHEYTKKPNKAARNHSRNHLKRKTTPEKWFSDGKNHPRS